MEDSKKNSHAAASGPPSSDYPLCALAVCVVWGATVLTLLCPALARAQDTSSPRAALSPASGLVITPYVSLQTVYDSNIFNAPGRRESDTILRLSPGIGVGYRSTRGTFNLLYSFDAERFSRHPNLNSWDSRQIGSIGGSYAFTRKLTAGLSADYLESYYPGELTPLIGVALTRTHSTRVSLRPTLAYQFNPRISAKFFYDRAHEHIAGGLTTDISTASAALIRDLTRRDQLTLQYQSYWYDFSSGTSPISHLFSIGWRHDFSRQTSLFIMAGPRETDGRTIADVNMGIRHNSGWATQSLSYTRSQLTLAGETGVYDTRTLRAAFGFRPTLRWYFDVEPGYFRVSLGEQNVEAYRVDMTAQYWFARDWAVALKYDYWHQRGIFSTVGNDALVLRNVISLSLTWALPTGPGHAVLPSRESYGAPSMQASK